MIYVGMNIASSMLRGGTNHLRIERGRWEGEKVEERVCRACNVDNCIEDELHFMLECPRYVRERARMFEEIRKNCDLDLETIRDNGLLLNLLIGEGFGTTKGYERVLQDILAELMIEEAITVESRDALSLI